MQDWFALFFLDEKSAAINSWCGQSDAGLICFIFSGRKIRGNKLMMFLFKPSVFFEPTTTQPGNCNIFFDKNQKPRQLMMENHAPPIARVSAETRAKGGSNTRSRAIGGGWFSYVSCLGWCVRPPICQRFPGNQGNGPLKFSPPLLPWIFF